MVDDMDTNTSASTHVAMTQQIAEGLSDLVDDARMLREVSNCNAVNAIEQQADGILMLASRVTDLEGKLKLLESIVREEHSALKELEVMEEEAQNRNKSLKAMLEAVEEKTTKSQPKHQSNTATVDRPIQQSPRQVKSKLALPKIRPDSVRSPSTVRPKVLPSSSSRVERVTPEVLHSFRPPTTTARPKVESPSNSFRFERVTRQEFESMPRTARGRISLFLINEALLDLELLLIKKFFSSSPKKPQLWRDGPDGERRGNAGRFFWATEQECRQSCAFFRHGESTARSTLLILRTLHRLRQVPGKHGEIIYLVPSSQN